MGWVHSRRDHGGLLFIDLRDRTGIVQVVLNPVMAPEAHERGKAVRAEDVLAFRGSLVRRSLETVNENLPTGRVELQATEMRILNAARVPPFSIEDEAETNENTRFRYRYLDLRRPQSLRPLQIRHRMLKTIRRYLEELSFIEVDTPVLTKSTPEGARDYLVPSRVNPGRFYALPQSPQLFKQILMVGGVDRYFQIARCFRDEDLRADRQPEFTQLDLEMSFVEPDDLFHVVEEMMVLLFKEIKGIDLATPFPRLGWEETVARYGTDKPDLRVPLELVEFSDVFRASNVAIFSHALERGGVVKALAVPGAADLSRKDLDDLVTFVRRFGAKGLAWIRLAGGDWQSPITKFLKAEEREAIQARSGVQSGDVIFFLADQANVVHESLAHLRLLMGEKAGLRGEEEYAFGWIVDFPLVEYSENEERYTAVHHPFTAPRQEDVGLLDAEPAKVKSRAYDLVLNGMELGGGSIRIHQAELQRKILSLLGLSDEAVEAQFGFFMEALEFGAPPHGGIAFGVDRMAMILSGASAIREVIAFPKSQRAVCMLTDAPTTVASHQLRELHIRTTVDD